MILNKNKLKLFNFIKRKNIDKLPTKAPNTILFILTFLFNIYTTEINNKKSKMKLIINTRS